MTVLLIEDEKAAARNLIALLNEVEPSIVIAALLDSVVESVEWLKQHEQPDLIFMDIHLADGSAFEIFERCSVTAPVIFTTAYDEYALRAFKVNSIDYLLKPISKEELQRALTKYKQLYQLARNTEDSLEKGIWSSSNSNQQAGIKQEVENLQKLIHFMQRAERYTTHLLIPKGGSQLIPLPINQVVCFYIEEGVVRAKTRDNLLHVVPYTLDQLTEMVDPTIFFRANRQFIITREDVLYMELWFGSRLLLRLHSKSEEKVIINKPRVSEFKAWFSGMQ